MTKPEDLLEADSFISTHTLTWSVTGDIGAVFGDYKDFNSHAHVERDPCQ